MVRLKATIMPFEQFTIQNFNSNMVRLKADFGSAKIAAVADFNSNMVRLKVILLSDITQLKYFEM
jgi:hypothetical protein